MDVSSLNRGYATVTQAASAQANTGAEKTQTTAKPEEEPAAVYAGSVDTRSGSAYTKTGKVNAAAMISQSESRINQFAQMINSLLGKQAKVGFMANQDALFSKSNLQAAFQNASAQDVAWAQSQIGEGGYYSVDATADRIFSMAESLAGGDPEKMEKMRAAVEKGFAQAERAFGGALPAISQQTHTRINEMFDNWGKTETK